MKKGLIAQERQRATLIRSRHDWISRRQPRKRATPHRLVFLDEPKVRVSETPVKTTMTRLRGRSPVGDRLFGTAPFGKWQTQTFIAGLTCTDLVAPWVIKAAMDRSPIDLDLSRFGAAPLIA